MAVPAGTTNAFVFIHPEDAKVVINMVNRKKPAKGITEKVVKEAFPSLIK